MLALGSAFDRIVYNQDFSDMIKGLSNMRFTCVRAGINPKVTVSPVTGDHNSTSLVNVVNTETLDSLVMRTWLDRSSAPVSRLA
ncbi:hypothetical protein BDM02DRAFT_1546587 [Thelephora ganbajun]|uniref:Uncharacterized protein n=1 Tax=Thelephora ganbajun TaxID=370292 RepID=A0ACB6Z164_THEGA|nr:hypothetical protein BDM02DRAFT_1546587 [Thelephora ganbajun]